MGPELENAEEGSTNEEERGVESNEEDKDSDGSTLGIVVANLEGEDLSTLEAMGFVAQAEAMSSLDREATVQKFGDSVEVQ